MLGGQATKRGCLGPRLRGAGLGHLALLAGRQREDAQAAEVEMEKRES